MNSFKKFIGIAALILLAAGAQPAISGVWQWSKTANSNATADPTINWAEGMSPSSVNDSARAMMAQIANWRDDISGLLTTGGTSTAYTLTTNSGLCSGSSTPTDGQSISATVNAANGANATLTVDSCTAAPIQSAPGVAMPSGTLQNGSPYRFKYSVANTAWMLFGFYSSPTNIPLGGLMPFTLTTAPNSNFIFAAGQCISTITYASYWAALGNPGPGSCGANQFQVIDTSGLVLAGLDTMPGFSAANRLTSSSTGCGTAMTSVGVKCANGNQSHTQLVSEMPNHNHTLHDPGHSHSTGGATQQGITANSVGGGTGLVSPGSTGGSTTGITIDAVGGGTAMPMIQPTVGVTYLLRVL